MKLLSSLVVVLLISSVSWSQEKIDKRLLNKYSVEELKSIETNNPNELKILTYALDNGMYLANYSKEKGHEFIEIDAPKKNQTYVDLNLDIKDYNQYYKVKGTEKLLVIKSREVLMNELKTK